MKASHPKITLLLSAFIVLTVAGWIRDAEGATVDLKTPVNTTITTLSGAGSTVTVPILLDDFTNVGSGTTGGVKVLIATLELSSGLKLSPTVATAVVAGGYWTTAPTVTTTPISALGANPKQYSINLTVPGPSGTCVHAATGSYPNGGEMVLVTVAASGTSLPATTTTEHVKLIPTPAGGTTETPSLWDCSSNIADPTTSPAVIYGTGHTDIPITVQQPCGPVGPPTGLHAAAVNSGLASPGNPVGIAGVNLTWTNPPAAPTGVTVDVWRAPFGFENPAGIWNNAYPEYDANALFPTSAPASPPANATSAQMGTLLGWTKIATVPLVGGATPASYLDRSVPRGFYYYVVLYTDQCSPSQASNMTTGTLNYLLADVNPSGAGDNRVGAADVSVLGNSYGTAGGNPLFSTVDYLDYGPTMDLRENSRPRPDGFIGFDDLMILALNYGRGPAPQFAAVPAVPAVTDHDELALDAPANVQAGETFAVTLRLRGAGDLQGVSTQLGWDAAVAEPVSVQPGEMIVSQSGAVFSTGPGNVDAAVLGAERPGLSGHGVLATVSFRARASGAPRIGLAAVDARDRANQKVDLLSGAPSAALATAFALVSPNPFNKAATLSFSLAKSGPAELAIYSVEGRRVRTLVRGIRASGVYRLTWDGADEGGRTVAPGVFFARLTTVEGRFAHRFVKLK